MAKKLSRFRISVKFATVSLSSQSSQFRFVAEDGRFDGVARSEYKPLNPERRSQQK
jgi:hypothetical protein